MDFKTYQEKAKTTAVYPNVGNNITYPTLGLCSESGEVAGKVKKIFRDDGGIISDEKREILKKEISDCLWYCAALCWELKLDMNEVAEDNIKKLLDRKNRGVIGGSGDNR
jgi:NTP pyrophosphatase (non-canonical NTP hydrolase)